MTDKADKPNLARTVMDLVAAEGLRFFLDLNGEPYAEATINGKQEIFHARGERMAEYISWLLFERKGMAASPSNISGIQRGLAGWAVAHTERTDLFVRVGFAPGAVYVDLGNEARDVVRVTAAGWDVIAGTDCPVKFRRPVGLDTLPTPVRGGKLDDLRPLVNCEDADWPLVKSWLVACLMPAGAYPILCWEGPQGSAKSTSSKLCKRLIDPNTVDLLTPPKSERDLAILAYNCFLPTVENLSKLTPELADAFCRLATGGGLRTRKLYTDDGETILKFRRPCIINGINGLPGRGDLIQRSISIYAPRIGPDNRRTEMEIMETFAAVHPFALGALLDAAVVGLRDGATIPRANLPRMSDYAAWSLATEPAWGAAGAWRAAYDESQKAGNEKVMEGSAVARAVLDWWKGEPWEGTMSELFEQLKCPADAGWWPRDARQLGEQLTRDAVALEDAGVRIRRHRSKTMRHVRVTSG